MKSFGFYWTQVAHLSLSGMQKTKIIYDSLLNIPDGDLAEIGVYRGATSLLMHLMYPDRNLHCYDTFEGIKGAQIGVDMHHNGEFACSLQDVQAVMGESDKIFYHVGEFPASFNENDVQFAYVHTDTDTYLGTKATIEIVYPRVVERGILMIDDYQWPLCPGVQKAIVESGIQGVSFGNQFMMRKPPAVG
jgi:O-methyltransferase